MIKMHNKGSFSLDEDSGMGLSYDKTEDRGRWVRR